MQIKVDLPKWGYKAILILACLVMGCAKEKKIAYVFNQKLFNEFEGKKELELKLSKVTKTNRYIMDSLTRLITQTSNYSVAQMHRNSISDIKLSEEELTEKYTADLWSTINQSVKEFGEQKGYDFIFGATGDGGLMYAKKGNDITDEVLRFMNDKYSGRSK
ncbi:MAG: OmpH family outer membrane protein [Flammeovirgaceae bacterium]